MAMLNSVDLNGVNDKVHLTFIQACGFPVWQIW